MVKCGVLFEVWTEFLNNIQTSFGLEALSQIYPVNILIFHLKLSYHLPIFVPSDFLQEVPTIYNCCAVRNAWKKTQFQANV
jgi:hypothetical protein